METLNMSYTINLDGGSQLLGFSSLMSIVLLIFALAAIIAIIKALAVLIPGAAIALVIWLLTSSPLYSGLAFIVVTLMMITYRR